MADPISGAVSGLIGIGQGVFGSKKRRKEQREAKAEYQGMMSKFNALDTSNPYANLQNPYEDLTVNQQEAQFLSGQQQQAYGNTLNQFKQAAGGSGLGALTQAIIGQQSQNLGASVASLGQQESANSRLTAQGAMQIQSQERQGEVISREWEQDKVGAQLGMSQQRLAAADQARKDATQSIIGGVGSLAGAVGSVLTGGASSAIGAAAGGGGSPIMQGIFG